MSLPKLSSYHTIENSQGTLDPLGLYSVADRLAGILAPSLRERMKHPRYLTAMAVGAIVCSEFDEDEVASDGVSPPWQVFEWYVNSAFIKRFENDSVQLLGLPGREKTTNAKKAGQLLNAARYLKTPGVFGFHGVYRTLAKGMNLLSGPTIGEFGIELVDAWEKEQDLKGFRTGVGSKGQIYRKTFVEVVRKGLAVGAVDRPWTWGHFDTIADSLAPKNLGVEEADLLYNKLTNVTSACRREFILFLKSKEGQAAIKSGSEKEVHNQFLRKAKEARSIIVAIMAYEEVSRLLFNAFYECLINMANNQCRGSIDNLSELSHVKKAFRNLPDAFEKLDVGFEPFRDETSAFVLKIMPLRESQNTHDWIKLLFDLHTQVQKQKPPNGRAPWILEHSNGNYLMNYSRPFDQKLNDEYVNQYRTFCLQSFLTDLRKI